MPDLTAGRNMADSPLQGQVAVVTGASQGIGRAVAVRLAAMGAAVVAASRSSTRLAELVGEITAAGGRARACPTDVRSQSAIDAMVNQALEWGRLDILVNNAGMGQFGQPLHEMPPEAWTATMETNLRSVYYALRSAVPHFIRQRRGHIINISSLVAHNPLPGGAAYAASKAALHQLSVSVAEELRAYGIRVSLVCPGSVDTDLSPDLVGKKDRSKMMRPEDVAHVVAMLVTQQDNSFVSEVQMRPTLKP
jgi:NAD(P)-dependent dehydrogenase (short-subunit alcohol dehydrogenase family)